MHFQENLSAHYARSMTFLTVHLWVRRNVSSTAKVNRKVSVFGCSILWLENCLVYFIWKIGRHVCLPFLRRVWSLLAFGSPNVCVHLSQWSGRETKRAGKQRWELRSLIRMISEIFFTFVPNTVKEMLRKTLLVSLGFMWFAHRLAFILAGDSRGTAVRLYYFDTNRGFEIKKILSSPFDDQLEKYIRQMQTSSRQFV